MGDLHGSHTASGSSASEEGKDNFPTSANDRGWTTTGIKTLDNPDQDSLTYPSLTAAQAPGSNPYGITPAQWDAYVRNHAAQRAQVSRYVGWQADAREAVNDSGPIGVEVYFPKTGEVRSFPSQRAYQSYEAEQMLEAEIGPVPSVKSFSEGLGKAAYNTVTTMAMTLMSDMPGVGIFFQAVPASSYQLPISAEERPGAEAFDTALLVVPGIGEEAGAAEFGDALEAKLSVPLSGNRVSLFGRSAGGGAEKILSPEERLHAALNNSKVYQRLEDIDITSSNSESALRNKLSALNKSQNIAEKVETTPNGTIRYYRKFRSARVSGPTSGARFVTEYDPNTGNVVEWNETYDQNGLVNRIHLKNINGIEINSPHFPPTLRDLLEQEFTTSISPRGGY